LGKIHVLHDFNEVLPLASTLSQELEQRFKLFILLALHVLPDDYAHVRDQILGSPSVSNFTSTCSTLLRVLGKHNTNIPTNNVNETSALHLSVMIALILASRAKGITSVTIVTSLAIKLTSVMLYMVALLNL